jgi:hypothetical protein
MRNPVNADYLCPFMNSVCCKRSHRIAGPYPVCSVWQRERDLRLVCLCPKRFYEAPIVQDVLDHCWPGDPPQNPKIAHEVQMKGFGNVDLVIADVDEQTRRVRKFVSVELQAVDTTGSVEPAYQAILASQDEAVVSYGINWANVRKRYVSQLVIKGFYHHQWGTRIVAVLQAPLYLELRRYLNFQELDPAAGGNAITFLIYDFVPNPDHEGAFNLQFQRAVATSHESLMMAALYRQVPPVEEFCAKILANLRT